AYTTLIHPKGTQAGVTREDKGEQRTTDTNGNVYYVKEELFRQRIRGRRAGRSPSHRPRPRR
ncbi:MAG: phage major capsid protein, partial [Sphingomonas sp.]